MRTYFIILIAIILSGIATTFQVVRESVVIDGEKIKTVHEFDNKEVSINKIRLYIFYIVPQDKTAQYYPDIQTALENVVNKLSTFHETTLSGLSEISSSIYHEPIIGLSNSDDYNGENTEKGNPNALKNLYEEIENRAFSKDGDITPYVKKYDDEYKVIYIVYEGVGASGTLGGALLNRRYLTEEEYAQNRDGYFAHEFYHTIGLLDGYDEETGISTSDDLMGLLKDDPLDQNFIGIDTLKHLGL